MPRVTLYVPDDLKTRMDDAGEAVNWSAVAQRAFREAVATHFIKKDASNMTDVVDRLRASKQRIEAAAYASGQDCGRTWAKESAEYDELHRVADFDQALDLGLDDLDEADLDTLKGLIDPESNMDRHDWESFFEQHGDGKPSDAFARGFISGAGDIYSEVADKL